MNMTTQPVSPVRRGVPAGRAAGAGFSLIELLVVISIISILAGFTLVVLSGISKTRARSTATAELSQIEGALEDYKAKYGVYPPSNPGLGGILLPPLYYELIGVTNTGGYFKSLDNSGQLPAAPAQLQNALGVGGFINCSKSGGDEAPPARSFLKSLKANRIGSFFINGLAVSNLVTSVNGPDPRYQPLGVPNLNPFRYMYPGTNNPNSYDLYVQLVFSGQTNLICNWSKEVIKNSPLP